MMVPVEGKSLLALVRALLVSDAAQSQQLLVALAESFRKTDRVTATALRRLASGGSSLLRRSATPSKLQDPARPDTVHDMASADGLLTIEKINANSVNPIFSESIYRSLNVVVGSHFEWQTLQRYELEPVNSVLFHGAPGVGKTLAAKWLAMKLDLPLATVNLSSVMSSYLGKSGANISKIIEHASNNKYVLFIDEFDSIAKQRSDETEIGELKRFVNILLQSFDRFDSKSLIVAATNHPELLDRAVWRRFDYNIEFNLPLRNSIFEIFTSSISFSADSINQLKPIIENTLEGESHSDIQRLARNSLRDSILTKSSFEESIINHITQLVRQKPLAIRKQKALLLINSSDVSKRGIESITGVSRQTQNTLVK